MTERVIADSVAKRSDGPQQRRLTLRAFADREKRRMHPRLREQIEDLRRPVGIRAVVERQVDVLRAHDSTLSLLKLRTSAARVSQYRRGSALPRSRMRAAGANTLINSRK